MLLMCTFPHSPIWLIENNPWLRVTGSPWEMLWLEIIQQGQFQATDVAKRNCCATGTGSGLTHCFLFGQSGRQRTATLLALSFFSETPFLTPSAVFCSLLVSHNLMKAAVGSGGTET